MPVRFVVVCGGCELVVVCGASGCLGCLGCGWFWLSCWRVLSVVCFCLIAGCGLRLGFGLYLVAAVYWLRRC